MASGDDLPLTGNLALQEGSCLDVPRILNSAYCALLLQFTSRSWVDCKILSMYAAIQSLHLCRLAMAKDITYDDKAKQKAHEAVDLKAMERELDLTEEAAEKLQAPVVWSHNDLLSGNILVTHQVILPLQMHVSMPL